MPDKEIEVKWTPFALQCLDDIHDYIIFREDDDALADEIISSILDRVVQLKEFPDSG